MSAPARRPIVSSDLSRLRAVDGVALHPLDGSVVYTVTWPDDVTDTNRAQIHVHDADGRMRQLSYGHRDHLPRFSPGGERLAFVRTTPGQPTVLAVLDWQSAALSELATFEDGIEEVHWVDDDRLAVLVVRRPADQEGLSDDELAPRPRTITRADYRFNGRGWTHDRHRQVAIVTISPDPAPPGGLAGTVDHLDELVADPGYPLTDVDHRTLAVAPDGDRIAVVAVAGPGSDLTHANEVWVHHLDGATPSRCASGAGGWWSTLVWHHQGPIVAVGSTDAAVYSFARPHRLDPDPTVATAPVVLGPHDANASPVIGPAGGPVAIDGAVLIVQPRRGAMTIDRYDLETGAMTPCVEDRSQVVSFDISPDGSRLVASITTLDRPAELYEVTGGELVKLVSLNDDVLAELDLATTEVVEVPTAGGHTVEAFITRPPASAPGSEEPRPGLVYVHGGPMSQYGYCFLDEFQMAAAEGFVVIGANPRGSDGYGEAWAQAVIGSLGTVDWDDISAVTDHLAAQPDVDPDRIGIGGGSYGGFLASWAIGHTDRYRAALVERAVTSWPSMVGTSDIGVQFVPKLLGATPESDLASLLRQSPLSFASAITTPTLILHSEHDWRCPIEQAEQLFVAILRNGGEAELVRFPDEDHELSRTGSPRHRMERFEIIHDFFRRHLDPAS